MAKKLTYQEAMAWALKNEKRIKELRRTMTAKEIAAVFGIEHNGNVNHALTRNIGPKGDKHGGSRKNSGNKKGIQFCGKCRKKLDKCTCDE